jgi:hypothetical protein
MCATVMIGMGVRIEGVPNLAGVEAKLQKALMNLRLRRVLKVAIDEDDIALAGD